MSLAKDSMRPDDYQAREQALDIRQSFIVQAPAGSGKTGLLVQRFLALLAQVDAPEEILAITFTRKATGEMRERLLGALSRADAPVADDADDFERQTWRLARAARQRDEAMGWELALHPSRLRILTIDALNAGLTRQMPLLSGFGQTPRITDDARELYRQAARQTLRGDQLDDEQFAVVGRLLDHLDGDYQQCESLLAAMLAQRQQWQVFLHLRGDDRRVLEQALAREIEDQLQAAQQALQPWSNRLVEVARFAGERVPAGKEADLAQWARQVHWPAPRVADLSLWRGLASLLLTKGGAWRKSWNKNIGLPSGSDAEKEQLKHLVQRLSEDSSLHDALLRIRQLPAAHYRDEQWAMLQDLLQVLRLAAAYLQLVFQDHGQVDHPEVALRALQALGDDEQPTDLALKLDYRMRHLLVDEFQDTSRAQVDLLRRLTAGWQTDDGRSLFLVGDPMQSIYRFRQAEVGLFLQARHEGLGPLPLTPLNLQTNFRSRAPIVAWVNQVFARLFPIKDDLAGNRVAYAASVAADRCVGSEQTTVGADSAVRIHPIFGERQQSDVEEARQVAAVAAQALDQDETVDVAILVRRRLDLLAIIPALRDAGLVFEAVEIESLAGQPVVQDLYALTRALLHPADQLAWLAVLRAPWCGLNLHAVTQLMKNSGNAPMQQRMHELRERLPETDAQRLSRVSAVLVEALGHRRRGSLRLLVESSWRRIGGPACLLTARERADAEAYFELLEQLDTAGDVDDPVAIEERLGGLYARADTSPRAARLKLMTVHKAKGLEFSTVILPGLHKGSRTADTGLLLWQERLRGGGEVDLLLGPLQARGADKDPVQNYVRSIEAEQLRQEQLRLLYVATTRARNNLHLFAAVEVKEDGDENMPTLKAPGKGSLLAEMWPQLQTRFETCWQERCLKEATHHQGPPSGHEQGILFADVPQRLLTRIAADWKPSPLPDGVNWRQAPISREPSDPLPFDWRGMRARHIGTVVHAWLERIAGQGLEQWSDTRITEEQGLMRHRLQTLGIPDEFLDKACGQVALALRETLKDERGRWILHPHRQARCEYELNAWLDHQLYTLIIDRTFIDDQGTRWIIDYKTASDDGGDREAFLKHEQERYQSQLETYARVIRQMEAAPIRLALYFPLLRAFCDWDYCE